jgi:hypothetical protein
MVCINNGNVLHDTTRQHERRHDHNSLDFSWQDDKTTARPMPDEDKQDEDNTQRDVACVGNGNGA